jgi:serine/threonine protein kinase
MGEVYEAEDTVKDRIVALKLLPEAVSHDPVFRKRLQREAHSAGRLQEPHVVPIHDYGEIEGLLYVDMRMIDGTDLRKMLKRYWPMTPARAVAVVRQIASALDAAHESGVMHRDVKPENIIITRDDFAYPSDAAADTAPAPVGADAGRYVHASAVPHRATSRLPHAASADERATGQWADVDHSTTGATSTGIAAPARRQGRSMDPDRGRRRGLRAGAGRLGNLVAGRARRLVIGHADDHDNDRDRTRRNHEADSANHDAHGEPRDVRFEAARDAAARL